MRMLSSRGDSAGMGGPSSAPHVPDNEFSQGGDDVSSGTPGPEISDEDIPF